MESSRARRPNRRAPAFTLWKAVAHVVPCGHAGPCQKGRPASGSGVCDAARVHLRSAKNGAIVPRPPVVHACSERRAGNRVIPLKVAQAFTAWRLQLRAHRGLQRELFAKQACVVSLLAPPHQAGGAMIVDPKMFYLDHPIPSRPRTVLRCKGLTLCVTVG